MEICFNKDHLKYFLESQYNNFNAMQHLQSYPDPLNIVYDHLNFKYLDELAFICACYAYGHAGMIVKNLARMPFYLLNSTSYEIENASIDIFPYYRFQTRVDTKNCFLAIYNSIKHGGLKHIFLKGYNQDKNVISGIRSIQDFLTKFLEKNKIKTYGLDFLFGHANNSTSPLKRYNMFIRWMVRKDSIDLGRWSEVDTSKLLLPLDTHTFRVTKNIGLCKSKTYNLKSVLEITANLSKFCFEDPIKYDFALYRIGQLGMM